MGTDVYLGWKGMTDEEHERQITGWSINAGNVGYLRASIGMVDENVVLSQIFPQNVWEHEGSRFEVGGTDYIEFDFEANYQNAVNAVIGYVLARFLKVVTKATGKSVEILDLRPLDDPIVGRIHDLQTLVTTTLKDNLPGGQLVMGTIADLPNTIIWASSVLSFLQLGISMQKKHGKAGVHISW